MVKREQMKRSRYLAGWVIRYHAFPTLNVQTIGHHQWRVATILVEVFGMPRVEVLYYALQHDVGEFYSGDLPFMVKNAIPGLADAMKRAEAYGLDQLSIQLPEISPLEKVQVKIADLLEMFEFGQMEVLFGNQYCIPVRDDTIAEARRLAKIHGLEKAIDAWERKHYEEATATTD